MGSIIVELRRLIYLTLSIITHRYSLVSVLSVQTVPFLLSLDIYLLVILQRVNLKDLTQTLMDSILILNVLTLLRLHT